MVASMWHIIIYLDIYKEIGVCIDNSTQSLMKNEEGLNNNNVKFVH